jgi:hypothetical protein
MVAIAEAERIRTRPYPWVYTPGPWAKAGMVAGGLFMLALSAGCFWMGLTPGQLPTPFAHQLMLVVSPFMGLASVLAVIGIFTAATVLTADEVRLRYLFSGDRMRRADIAGYRFIEAREIKLIPKPNAGKGLTITVYRPDDDFRAWFEGIPNLDAEDAARAHQALLENPDFGETVQARQTVLGRLGRLVRWGTGLAMILVLWIFVWPQPYEIAILAGAVAPIAALALVALTGGRLAIWSPDARPNVGLMMYPGMILAVRAMFDVHLYHWEEIAAPTGVIAALAIALSWMADRRLSEHAAILSMFGIAAAIYAYGVAAEADMLLDRAKPQVIQARVLAKRISSGGRPEYDLTLAPWGDRQKTGEIHVGSRLYGRANKGDVVCVRLHPGRLGARWFSVGLCPPAPAPIPPPPARR